MSSSRLFDAGLQPERTLLAWRRTCLSLAIVVLAVVKVMAPESAAASVVLAVAGLGLPVAAWILATVRYRRINRALTAADPTLPAAGSAVTVAALGAAVVGVLSMILVSR